MSAQMSALPVLDKQAADALNLSVLKRMDNGVEEVCISLQYPPPSPPHPAPSPGGRGAAETGSACGFLVIDCANTTMLPQILATAGHVALYNFDTETKAWVRTPPALCTLPIRPSPFR